MLSWKSMPSCCGSKTGLVSTSPVESLSMTRVGGTRPPGPTTVGAIGLPPGTAVTVGRKISVSDRLSGPQPESLNSCTTPLNVTAVPTGGLTFGLNRKMPSDVRTSVSG